MWVSFANEMECHVKTEKWYATQKEKVFRRHYAFDTSDIFASKHLKWNLSCFDTTNEGIH